MSPSRRPHSERYTPENSGHLLHFDGSVTYREEEGSRTLPAAQLAPSHFA